jgi:hypothetical protein
MMDDGYSYRVVWSVEDHAYVAACDKFPSLSWLAEDTDEALRGIVKLVAETVADMRVCGESIGS